MNERTRRLYLNNWAILAVDNEVQWHFGDITEDELIQTINFVNALGKLGAEILGQVIGVIRLRYPKPHPTQADEIMVVSLMDKYHIVISDPLVTTRLMRRIELDSDPVPPFDDMRSILAGGASVIYSKFYEQEVLDHRVVDSFFQEAVSAVTYSEKVFVGEGQCSFSALSLEELLFFHALLKELFEAYYSVVVPGSPWGAISSLSGADIYLTYEPPVDAALISSLASVIVNYTRFLFGAFPERLIFGMAQQSVMDFIATDTNLFVINNPKKLLTLQKFQRKWKKIPTEVAHDLAPAMKDYFTELTLLEQRERIKNLKFHRLINFYTKMGIRRARAYKLSECEG
ncbi:MAG: hypothetical protein JSV04_08995 [Candidatus Heimdallarchaeota archaeon]|nr:MAG: hypothetical protein JSV04_08995 [Candidatus Heimdallarchaeota archaeon]